MRKEWENLSREELVVKMVKNLQVSISINNGYIKDTKTAIMNGKDKIENAKKIIHYQKVNEEKNAELEKLMPEYKKYKPNTRNKINVSDEEAEKLLASMK